MDESLLLEYKKETGIGEFEVDERCLARILKAHLQTYPFSNIPVLLGEHLGVQRSSTIEALVLRKKGGYCFDHAQTFASVLKSMGFDVLFRMGRVGDEGPITHLVLQVFVENEAFLVDPGLGFGPMVPIPLSGEVVSDLGFEYRVSINERMGVMSLEKKDKQNNTWSAVYEIYDFPVKAADVYTGHFVTSAFPGSIFKNNLMVGIFEEDEHRMLTHESLITHKNGKVIVKNMLPSQVLESLPEFRIEMKDSEIEQLNKILFALTESAIPFGWLYSS